jgi:hypothetical protein
MLFRLEDKFDLECNEEHRDRSLDPPTDPALVAGLVVMLRLSLVMIRRTLPTIVDLHVDLVLPQRLN